MQQERESVRHVSLQKDLELRDLQTRLDKNVCSDLHIALHVFLTSFQGQEFSKTRESLIEAQTSRKHLEEKVEDLNRQLKGNEEKLAVYERRPGTTGAVQTAEPGVSREQQLESEVAELR